MTPAGFYVYLHIRPDGTPFYVGKGKGKRSREFSKRNRHHRNTVVKHKPENIQVCLIPAESEEHAFWGEIELIRCFRALGYSLCNMTDGGEGCSGLIQSADHREKRSVAMRGKTRGPQSADHIAKMIAAKIGKPLSANHRANVSAALKGKPSPLKGKPRSADSIAKSVAARTGKPNRVPAWNKGLKKQEKEAS